MIQVIYFSSLLSVPGRTGAFSRDLTTSLAPECRAFSGAMKIEKLKAPLIPGPEGAVDTNDWCIRCIYNFFPTSVEFDMGRESMLRAVRNNITNSRIGNDLQISSDNMTC